MSNWREELEADNETQAVVEWLTEYYHYPVLFVLFAFAFWNRVRNYENFIVNGQVLYGGNDPWYHMRSTEYAVENFPETMPFDPWTYFPQGTSTGQFGTLFDQLIAFVALVVGLGNPDQFTVRFMVLISPAIFGMLVGVPAYFIGRRVGNRFGGLVAVAFVALAPDRLLQVSLAGSAQHEVAEALFMGLGVLGVMVALSVAERDLPVYELVADREFEPLRPTVGWSMLAGVAIGVYLWVWPPGVLLVGILGVFFVLHLSFEHIRGRSPEHAGFVGAVSLGTAGALQLGGVRTVELSAASRSLLQPGLPLAVAVGVVAMVWLSREIHTRELSPLAYPAIVSGSIVAVALASWLLLPGVFDFFVGQVDRVLGFVTAPGAAESTIGEGQPGDLNEHIIEVYWMATFTALLGAIIVVVRQALKQRPKGEELLLVVWAAFMVAATLTQLRFGYYLTLVIGGLNAVLVGTIMQYIDSPDRRALPETYEILTIAVVVLVMFVPLLGLPLLSSGGTAVGQANNQSQPGDIVGWNDSLNWMSENTPEPGQYGNPDGEPMAYYGQYDRTDDFAYPNGSYGVLSWWDYGHWITAEGERIPNANPFQQNAENAANFLLAQNESTALDVLEERLDDGENAQTRYVMVDTLMAQTETRIGGKFFAPADFHDDYNRSDFYSLLRSEQNIEGVVQKQPYYESMLTRLYHFHGSSQDRAGTAAQDGQPFVVEWQGREAVTEGGTGLVNVPQNDSIVRFAPNISAAQSAVEGDPSNQLGGIGPHPPERVSALEQFRLVYMDEVPAVGRTGGNDARFSDAADRGLNTGTAAVLNRDRQLLNNAPGLSNESFGDGNVPRNFLYSTTPSFTKTFERVPGATIEGTLPENATGNNTSVSEATISVGLEPENGNNFTYTQQVEIEDGEFTATVPYATTGYDEYGVEEGYTNTSVRALDSYRVRTGFAGFDSEAQGFVFYNGTVDVEEGKVIGEDPEPATLELERSVQEINLGGNGGSGSEDG